MSQEHGNGPLAGLVILDLTHFLAGPYGTQILGDLGARVIKIESAAGEPTRTLAPHFFKGESAYFLSVNRNKESIALDLKSERGREILYRLVRSADALLESFRPGVAERLGIDYERLKRENPRLVYGSLSGFGQSGPYRNRPAYDVVVQALSGGMSMTGEEGGRGVRAGMPIGDLAAGMFSVIGLLAGLFRAREQGVGAHVDISMLDCQISMLTYQAAYHLLSGEVPGPQGRGHRSFATYRAFLCADGVEVVIAANTQKMWLSMCEALGLPELTRDPLFRSNDERLENISLLHPILERAFAGLSSAEAVERLSAVDVAVAPIQSIDRALNDPQVLARNMVIGLEDKDGQHVHVTGNPVKFTDADTEQFSFPPSFGEHTETVLRELADVAADEFALLQADGVVPRTSLRSETGCSTQDETKAVNTD